MCYGRMPFGPDLLSQVIEDGRFGNLDVLGYLSQDPEGALNIGGTSTQFPYAESTSKGVTHSCETRTGGRQPRQIETASFQPFRSRRPSQPVQYFDGTDRSNGVLFRPPPGLEQPALRDLDCSEFARSASEISAKCSLRPSSRTDWETKTPVDCRSSAGESQDYHTATAQRALVLRACELDSHARPDRVCSRERPGKSFVRSGVRNRRLCRAERRRVRWNDLRQLRQRNQAGWSSSAGKGEKKPRGAFCYHPRVPRGCCEEGLGGAPGGKLELDKACLRGGSRSLRPLQKPQAFYLHDRRRPRRGARREPGKAAGYALSDLHRVRERSEGPESRLGLGLARPRHTGPRGQGPARVGSSRECSRHRVPPRECRFGVREETVGPHEANRQGERRRRNFSGQGSSGQSLGRQRQRQRQRRGKPRLNRLDPSRTSELKSGASRPSLLQVTRPQMCCSVTSGVAGEPSSTPSFCSRIRASLPRSSAKRLSTCFPSGNLVNVGSRLLMARPARGIAAH